MFLLDGFDEMGQQTDKNVKRENFKKLLPLLLKSAKTIITCRPAYFVTDKEMKSVMSQLSNYTRDTQLKGTKLTKKREYDNFLNAANYLLPKNISKEELVDTTVVNLLEFTKENIDQYIDTFINEKSPHIDGKAISASAMRRRITNTYDLKDLSKRPILLEAISKKTYPF